ncbi:MAG: hypothetical protein ABSE95_03595 [Thermodesulfobacteriota bacterium]|jgi:hypothetical protein
MGLINMEKPYEKEKIGSGRIPGDKARGRKVSSEENQGNKNKSDK